MSSDLELSACGSQPDAGDGRLPGSRVSGIREVTTAGTRNGLPVVWLRGEPEQLSPNHQYYPTYVIDSENWEWLSNQYDNPMPPAPYTRDQIAIWSKMVLERPQ
jgi:hypothetical protein